MSLYKNRFVYLDYKVLRDLIDLFGVYVVYESEKLNICQISLFDFVGLLDLSKLIQKDVQLYICRK